MGSEIVRVKIAPILKLPETVIERIIKFLSGKNINSARDATRSLESCCRSMSAIVMLVRARMEDEFYKKESKENMKQSNVRASEDLDGSIEEAENQDKLSKPGDKHESRSNRSSKRVLSRTISSEKQNET